MKRWIILELPQAELSCFRRSGGNRTSAERHHRAWIPATEEHQKGQHWQTKGNDGQFKMEHLAKRIQWQYIRPSIYLLASKVLFSFSEFRILQSVNISCSLRKVNFPAGWELKSRSESTSCSTTILSWRSAPRNDRRLCLTQDHYENLRIFSAADSGQPAVRPVRRAPCPLRNVAKSRRNSVVGETSKGVSLASRDESTVRRIVHFLQVQFMLIFMALLAYKMLRLLQDLERTQLEEEVLYAWNRTFFILYKEWLNFYTQVLIW